MLQMEAPKTKRQVRHFIGLINYYRDIWKHRSDLLAPLSTLTSKNATWQWTDKHKEAFKEMKRIIAKDVTLSYPDFSQPFDIHTDVSHTQLGAVISQNSCPIAF